MYKNSKSTRHHNTQTHKSYTSHTPSHHTFTIHSHLILHHRLNVHLPVSMNRRSILTAIIHLFLKSFLECVRLRTFGKCGYQQLQVIVEIFFFKFFFPILLICYFVLLFCNLILLNCFCDFYFKKIFIYLFHSPFFIFFTFHFISD